MHPVDSEINYIVIVVFDEYEQSVIPFEQYDKAKIYFDEIIGRGTGKEVYLTKVIR